VTRQPPQWGSSAKPGKKVIGRWLTTDSGPRARSNTPIRLPGIGWRCCHQNSGRAKVVAQTEWTSIQTAEKLALGCLWHAERVNDDDLTTKPQVAVCRTQQTTPSTAPCTCNDRAQVRGAGTARRLRRVTAQPSPPTTSGPLFRWFAISNKHYGLNFGVGGDHPADSYGRTPAVCAPWWAVGWVSSRLRGRIAMRAETECSSVQNR
jgi:hypothetical protein